jgi:DNA repair protein RecN (Recombination protein N)
VLQNLVVNNIGVIKEASLDLEPGLIAITGETGAGKSMLLGALSLIQGNNLVHIDKKDMCVQAVFSHIADKAICKIKELGGHIDDNELIISREFDDKSGRFKAVVGGKIASASFLNQISADMITIHGQSEQLTLKNSKKVRELIDVYASLGEELDIYSRIYKDYCLLKTRLENAKIASRENKEQLEFLRFAIDKIEEVNPSVNEDIELKAKISACENVVKIGENMNLAIDNLMSEEDDALGAVFSLTNAINALQTASSYDPELLNAVDSLKSSLDLVNETKSALHEHLFTLEYNPNEVDKMNQRLSQLGSLTTLWGPSIADVLEFYDSALQKVQELADSESLDSLGEQVKQAEIVVKERAYAISKRRIAAAQNFSTNVTKKLKLLGFNSSVIQVNINQNSKFDSTGIDEVELLFSPHKSTKLGPLSKIASGGELSRIMLAIELEIATSKHSGSSNEISTLVFDEVDAGVGGEAALTVANLLKEVSSSAQVIVVTHLASVAAKAHQHFLLEKSDTATETTTCIRQILADERVHEIARMLSGSETKVALEHARALLK